MPARNGRGLALAHFTFTMFAAAGDGTFPHDVGPRAVAVSTPAANSAPLQIRSVSFASSTVRSDRVVAATLDCVGGQRRAVSAEPLTPGFEIELLPQRAREDGRIVLAVRIHRRLGTVRRLCLVRFCVGDAAATASITVLH